MVVSVKQKMSVEAFDKFAQRPENADKVLELIGREVFEVPSNPYVSMITGLILTAFNLYLHNNPIGQVTGEVGGYRVADECYALDVAFISYAQQPELARTGDNPLPPELVAEAILDPENHQEQRQLRTKLTVSLAAGVLVWVVNPDDQGVEVHQVSQSAYAVDATGTLTGADVLPGFELLVKDVFPLRREEQEAK